ncbi:MAG: hypothetical protein NT120_02590 [Candidatus Aenigmarchaeota archaeon]|nr:hypothetical protein [Candidatus Aenigmarchaeota archaeon]
MIADMIVIGSYSIWDEFRVVIFERGMNPDRLSSRIYKEIEGDGKATIKSAEHNCVVELKLDEKNPDNLTVTYTPLDGNNPSSENFVRQLAKQHFS